MTIQIPNLGSGNGLTGDNELVIRQKYNANFSDQTNAASRLVGPSQGNVMEVGAFGVGASAVYKANIAATTPAGNPVMQSGFYESDDIIGSFVSVKGGYGQLLIGGSTYNAGALQYVYFNTESGNGGDKTLAASKVQTIYSTQNVTKDANGFLKGASPVIDMYDNKIGLNQDAEQQGGITFEKVGTGDYLIKGSLGFAQEGWYIETPKDANGNVLVAVVYEQLVNNDISIKTYAKRFDDETGDIVANLLKPRDIPTGRFISLRLHELPSEPPTEV